MSTYLGLVGCTSESRISKTMDPNFLFFEIVSILKMVHTVEQSLSL